MTSIVFGFEKGREVDRDFAKGGVDKLAFYRKGVTDIIAQVAV